MRTEPLKVTKCDEKEFVEYSHLLGYPSYGEYASYFHDKHKNPLHLEGMYGGESLFIIAGGPSLKSINFSLLQTPGVMTMTINNSCVPLLLRSITPTFGVTCDLPDSFVQQYFLNPNIIKFAPWNLFGKPLWSNEDWKPLDIKLKECINMKWFTRNEKLYPPRFFQEKTINWGMAKDIGDLRSTLLASLKIAFVLGFRNIYLLGVDFNMDKDKTYAFNEGRSKHLINSNMRNYKLMAEEYLPKIKKEGEKLNFNIFNCNIDSNLKIFEYVSLEEAVRKATIKCSPTNVIETKGLYNLDYKDKLKLTRQEAINKNSN